MVNKARRYKPTTTRRLDTLSGNQCYNPDCSRKLIGHDGTTIISKICHISAASENGPRYNINMDDEERRGFDNLILLCDECHSIIDNPKNIEIYSIELLKQWKKHHENKLINEHIRNPSLLRLAINALSKTDFENDEVTSEDLLSFKISNKIEYNSITRNKALIEEYKIYYSKINSLYLELEKQGSFKKDNLLRNIKRIYLKVKGKYILDSKNELEILRENSDNIIEDIEEELQNLIDYEKNGNFSFEISIIMVDAFMRCKILENPTTK